MPSADQVPVNSTHSTMRWPEWVVLIAGSTGSALRAVRPFQPSRRASRHGANEELFVLGPGFSRRMLASLVRAGLAATRCEVIKAGAKTIEVALRFRITAAGRRGLEDVTGLGLPPPPPEAR